MYNYLKTIGLEKYLDEYFCNRTWKRESYLEKLDLFVSGKSEKQKVVLKDKFQINKTHRQLNDHVNEIKVACAYHPLAIFIKEDGELSPDLLDNSLKIEIKTINESGDEAERHENMEPDRGYFYFGRRLTEKEETDTKVNVSRSVENKCLYHLNKATKQIENSGRIYLIYDWDILFKQDQNSRIHAPLTKNDIKNILESTSNNFCKNCSNVSIKIVSTEELKNDVENNSNY